jgi:phosphate transport system permease protein
LADVILLKKKKHLLKTNFKQIKEKVIEFILMLVAATSITVILIVFSIYEGVEFLPKPIDKGFYWQ